MSNLKFEAEIAAIHKADAELLVSKNSDYGNVWQNPALEDTFLLDQVIVKVMRAKELLKKAEAPNYESLADSIRDARNYLVLAELRLTESQSLTISIQ